MIPRKLYSKSLRENCCAGAFFLIEASGVENHFPVNFTIFITFLQNSCTRFKIQSHCKKNEVSIKDFFSKCDQICSFLRIWPHLLKKSVIENFIFLCSVFFCFMCLPTRSISFISVHINFNVFGENILERLFHHI